MNVIRFEVEMNPIEALGIIKSKIKVVQNYEKIAATTDGRKAVTLVLTKPHFRESVEHSVVVTIDDLNGRTEINAIASSSLHGMTGIDIKSPGHLAMDVKAAFSGMIVEDTLYEEL